MNKQDFDKRHHSYVGDYLNHRLHHSRYSNNGEFALVVVASLNFATEDESLLDWTAYWAGTDKTRREEDAVRYSAKHGNKLSSDDAAHFFPGFPMTHFRT